MEKMVDGNYARILWAISNKSWKQHPTKQQLYGHLPPISKTIQIRLTRHTGHCCRRWAGVVCPARTYLQQLCTDTGCNLEDLTNVIDNKWMERENQGNPCSQHNMIIYATFCIQFNAIFKILLVLCLFVCKHWDQASLEDVVNFIFTGFPTLWVMFPIKNF